MSVSQLVSAPIAGHWLNGGLGSAANAAFAMADNAVTATTRHTARRQERDKVSSLVRRHDALTLSPPRGRLDAPAASTSLHARPRVKTISQKSHLTGGPPVI